MRPHKHMNYSGSQLANGAVGSFPTQLKSVCEPHTEPRISLSGSGCAKPKCFFGVTLAKMICILAA